MDDTNFSRDIRLYWPEHIQSIKEFQEIDKAVNIEIENTDIRGFKRYLEKYGIEKVNG